MKRLILILLLFISYDLYSGKWEYIGSVSTDQIYGYNVIGNYISWSGLNYWIVDSTNHTIDEENLIMTSTDSGETWFKSLSLTGNDSLFGKSRYSYSPTLYNFDSPGMMILANHDQFILTSSDLGATWNARQLLDKNYSYDSMEVGHISMADSLHGALSYYYINIGHLYVTDDGWKSWRLLEIPDKPYIYEIKRFDSSTYVLYGANAYPDYYFWKSTDAGNTWEKGSLKAKLSSSNGIYIKSKDEYWYYVLYSNSKEKIRNVQMYKTTNAGKDWVLKLDVPDTSFGGIRGMAFADDGLHGIAINANRSSKPNNYSYFYTEDGGDTWKKYYLDSAFNGVFDLEKPIYRDKDYFFMNGTGFIAKVWVEKDTLSIVENDIDNNDRVVIYPNPVQRNSQINLNIRCDDQKRLSIKTYDLSGSEMDHYESETLISGINVIRYEFDKDINPGIYIFIINLGDEKYERKVIIQ